MVSATLQDIIRRYLVTHKDESFDTSPRRLPQLNDTHPTIGVPELMRLLMDEHVWDGPSRGTSRHASSPSPTTPCCLRRWRSAGGAGGECAAPPHADHLRHQLRFTQELRGIMGDDYDRIGRMSIIEEGEGFDKSVRMAHLALVASHTVNGVAAIHRAHQDDDLQGVLRRHAKKFQNKTNGVTQRRWLAFCNPALVAHLRDARHRRVGEGAGSPAGFASTRTTRRSRRSGRRSRRKTSRSSPSHQAEDGVEVPTNALFDIQVKRIHEYKRQLLNVRHHPPLQCAQGDDPAERKQQVPACASSAARRRLDTTWRSASSSSCPRWETQTRTQTSAIYSRWCSSRITT